MSDIVSTVNGTVYAACPPVSTLNLDFPNGMLDNEKVIHTAQMKLRKLESDLLDMRNMTVYTIFYIYKYIYR